METKNVAYIPIVHACEIFKGRHKRYPGDSSCLKGSGKKIKFSFNL
jgi:hypothetical protein